MHSCLSMNLCATFAFLLPGHPTLSTTFDYLKQRKKTAEKIDTNAQWFHCSWSILLKRVNIRVRGFHLVFFPIFFDMCFFCPSRFESNFFQTTLEGQWISDSVSSCSFPVEKKQGPSGTVMRNRLDQNVEIDRKSELSIFVISKCSSFMFPIRR